MKGRNILANDVYVDNGIVHANVDTLEVGKVSVKDSKLCIFGGNAKVTRVSISGNSGCVLGNVSDSDIQRMIDDRRLR